MTKFAKRNVPKLSILVKEYAKNLSKIYHNRQLTHRHAYCLGIPVNSGGHSVSFQAAIPLQIRQPPNGVSERWIDVLSHSGFKLSTIDL